MKYAEVQVSIPNLEGDGIAETHTIKVPVTIDPHTGEELLTEEAVEMIDNTKARYMGLLLPNEIKELRQRLNLTQKQMSELLQAGEKSYTRWESGKARPSRMVNLLLRALFEGALTPEQLKRIGAPRTQIDKAPAPAKPVSVWLHTLDTGFGVSQWEPFPKAASDSILDRPSHQFTETTEPFLPKRSEPDMAERARHNQEHRARFSENLDKDARFA